MLALWYDFYMGSVGSQNQDRLIHCYKFFLFHNTKNDWIYLSTSFVGHKKHSFLLTVHRLLQKVQKERIYIPETKYIYFNVIHVISLLNQRCRKVRQVNLVYEPVF